MIGQMFVLQCLLPPQAQRELRPPGVLELIFVCFSYAKVLMLYQQILLSHNDENALKGSKI